MTSVKIATHLLNWGVGTSMGTEEVRQEVANWLSDKGEAEQADVVELVNLKGDTTTAYKLADGRYMDRIDRIFVFNGTDTWTDENGVEWNEAVN